MQSPSGPKVYPKTKLKGLEEMADEGTADAKMQKVRKLSQAEAYSCSSA